MLLMAVASVTVKVCGVESLVLLCCFCSDLMSTAESDFDAMSSKTVVATHIVNVPKLIHNNKVSANNDKVDKIQRAGLL
jgi:hypothetical protein